MRFLTRPRLAPSLLVCAAGASVPAALLLAVGEREVHISSAVHFGAVGASGLAAALAALVLSVVGARRGDGRTVLVATAFSAMAGLLFLHGLASPGVLVDMNGLVAFSGAATLPAGAAILSLSTLPLFRGVRGIGWLLALQAILLATIAVLGTIGMLVPASVPQVPETGGTAALVTVAAGLGLYGYLALRAVDTYLLTQRLADAAVVVGLAWLGASLVGALMFDFMQAGWWLGHGFELVGLVTIGVSIGLDLHRANQSQPLAGGPPAADLVAAEESFLGARVRALTLRLADKDTSTEEHTRRVALRAVQVGEELGLPPVRLRRLATGGLLHDIGKLAVPDAVLKKPGPLTPVEFDLVRRHPEWGHRLLGELGDFADGIRRLVLDHHERLDGTGYPRGLRRAELDLETRILAVCDVYDALISTRVYRDAWSHERAVAFLHENAGSEFDPKCVVALERVLRREREPELGLAV